MSVTGLVGVMLFAPVGLGYRGLFIASLCARLLLGLLAPRLLGPIGTSPPIGRRQLVMRLIGLRTNSGANLRPVDEPIGESEPSAEGRGDQARPRTRR